MKVFYNHQSLSEYHIVWYVILTMPYSHVIYYNLFIIKIRVKVT